MKIRLNKKWNRLPEMIGHCTSPVYMLLSNDRKVALNVNADILEMFDSVCKNSENMTLDLQFSDPREMSEIFRYLVNA